MLYYLECPALVGEFFKNRILKKKMIFENNFIKKNLFLGEKKTFFKTFFNRFCYSQGTHGFPKNVSPFDPAVWPA